MYNIYDMICMYVCMYNSTIIHMGIHICTIIQMDMGIFLPIHGKNQEKPLHYIQEL